MKNTLILTLILLTLIPFTYAANDFSYNRLYSNQQVIDGFNYSINVNHSTTSDFATLAGHSNSTNNWVTISLGTLDDVNTTQFNNIAGTLTIDPLYIDANWCALTGCTMEGNFNLDGNDIIMDGGNLLNATQISLKDSISQSAFLNITTDLPGGDESQINIVNTNDLGFSGIRYVNSDGDESFAGLFSRDLSQFGFPNIVEENQSISGMASVGGPIFIATTENNSIYFGGGPSDSLLDTDFFLRINPILKSLEIQGDKSIRPVTTDGVQTMVFESNIGAVEGEITFAFFATDSDNNSIAQRVFGIGKNNSASIQGMNSQIVATKDYLTMPDDVKVQWDNNTGDTIIEEWFNNITSCFFLQEHYQNLGLLPEGLMHFCDSSGRLAPQSILGDLTVVREVVGHEGGLFFENFDIIIRDNSTDVDIIGGRALHIRRPREEEIGVAPGENVNRLLADFEQNQLDPFVLITTGKGGDEWDTVSDSINCPPNGDFCAHAGPTGGSSATIMESNITTQNTQDMNLTFNINTVDMPSGGLLVIDIENSTTSTNLYTLSLTDASDLFVNVAIPSQWNNLSLVTISASFLSTHPIRADVWIDTIRVDGIASASTLENVTRQDGEICFSDGVSRGDGSNRCIYDIFWNDSTKNLIIPGNTTFEDVTQVDLNITTSITLNGTQLFDWGDIPDFFKLDGTTPMQANANFGDKNITNANWGFFNSLNISGTIIGPSSEFAQYEFLDNNFNGSGSFTTTGSATLGSPSSVENTGSPAIFRIDKTDGNVMGLFVGGVSTDILFDNTMTFNLASNNPAIIRGSTPTVGATNRMTIATNGDFDFYGNAITTTGVITGKEVFATRVESMTGGRITLGWDQDNGIKSYFPFAGVEVMEFYNGGFLFMDWTEAFGTQTWNVHATMNMNNNDLQLVDTAFIKTVDLGVNIIDDDGWTGNMEIIGALNVTDVMVANRLVLGQHNESVNSSLNISSGDIVGQNAYFNAYFGRSILAFCDPSDWTCKFEIPKYQKSLWTDFNQGWIINRIYYEGSNYTKSQFNSQICSQNQKSQDVCDKLNSKVLTLQADYQADALLKQQEASCNYRWNGKQCFEIVRTNTTYISAVESYEKIISEQYSCLKLDIELREVESVCQRDSGATETKYRFKKDCDYDYDNAVYYCEVRELR